MQECEKCGKVIPKDSHFCTNCGEPSKVKEIKKKTKPPKSKSGGAPETLLKLNSNGPKNSQEKNKKQPKNLIDLIPPKEPKEVQIPKKDNKEKTPGLLARLFEKKPDAKTKETTNPEKPKERRCKNCGAKLLYDSNFCLTCGANPDTEAEKAPLKELGTSKAPISPHLKKKKTTTVSSILLLVALVVALLVIISAYYSFFAPPASVEECYENWVCGSWSDCISHQKNRTCSDNSECGTDDFKPIESADCDIIVNETNVSLCAEAGQGCIAIEDCCHGYCVNNLCQNEKPCVQLGEYCDKKSECCSDYCTHHVCRDNVTFCGDGYCDMGENCQSCSYDCGECPQDRDLKQNVFTEPIDYFKNMDYIDNGYVVLKYFYSLSCDYCYSPANIENQLRNIAPQLKDILVLEIVDAYKETFEADKYAKVGNVLYTPFIRIEGKVNNQTQVHTLYGADLGDMLADGDITQDVAKLICQSSDYCEYVDNRIVKTYTN